MLCLVACLLGQLLPTEIKSPTLQEFEAPCQKAKADSIAERRKEIDATKPSAKQIARQSRTVTQKALNAIRARHAELDAEAKDDSRLPVPQLLVHKLEAGQVGELLARTSSTTNAPIGGVGRTVVRADVTTHADKPAVLKVLSTTRNGAIVCEAGDETLVLVNYKGPAKADGKLIATSGLYRVCGHYELAGGKFLAIEQWEHNAAWQQRRSAPLAN